MVIEVFQPSEIELVIQGYHAKNKPRAFDLIKNFNEISSAPKLIEKMNYELSKPVYCTIQKKSKGNDNKN